MSSKSAICFSCCEDKALTEEHIIPQAIGGKLSTPIYCNECNSKFGSDLDSELTKRLGHFGTALRIDRDRGKHQPYEVSLVNSCVLYLFPTSLARLKVLNRYMCTSGGRLRIMTICFIWNFFGFKAMTKNDLESKETVVS